MGFEFLDGSRGFASDNGATVHPRIMQALIDCNIGHGAAYGYDAVTKYADELFDKLFKRHVKVYYVFNGTGCNCTALAHFATAGQTIICADNAHIHTTETGCPERFTSAKIVPIASDLGIIDPNAFKSYLTGHMNEHVPSPCILSLTQITDAGKVYQKDKLREICDIAHEFGIKVHMDGARIANAVAALDDDLIGSTYEVGVDVLSFGGTKNGFMFGEAIVFFDENLARGFKSTRKSCGQLASKMRYISAQFAEAIKDGLWLSMGHHSNDMAMYMYEKMSKEGIFKTPYKPEANIVFAFVDDKIREKLMEKYPFNNIGPLPGISRFVTSFDTTKEDIDELVEYAKKLAI